MQRRAFLIWVGALFGAGALRDQILAAELTTVTLRIEGMT